MKAPHEETWRVEEEAENPPGAATCWLIVDHERPHDLVAETWSGEAARLIAAAPEMARALLRLHNGEVVSSGCIREALRSAGVIPSFEEEAAALEKLDAC